MAATDPEYGFSYRCPYAGKGHARVLFGHCVRATITPSWWGLPLVVSFDPMRQIGVLCFRVYWWKHDEQNCKELQAGMVCT